MRIANGYISMRMLVVVTCCLVVAAGIIVGVSLHRGRSSEGEHAATMPSAGEQAASNTQRGVIGLSPALCSLLFQVGAGDALVGVSSFFEQPPGFNLPVVGDNQRINREHALRLRPRVIVYQQDQTDTLRQLNKDGVALEQFKIETIEDIKSAMRRLVEIAGVGDAGPAIGRLEADLASARNAVADRPRRRVLLTMGRYPIGRGTFLDECLTIAGGENVMEFTGYGSNPHTAEQFYRLARGPLAPEVIIDMVEHPVGQADIAIHKAAWAVFEAIPPDRIHLVYDLSLTVPDGGVGRSALTLARLVHPEAFASASQPDEPGQSGGEQQ